MRIQVYCRRDIIAELNKVEKERPLRMGDLIGELNKCEVKKELCPDCEPYEISIIYPPEHSKHLAKRVAE